MASTYQSIALAYYHRAQYQTALQYYLTAVPFAQKSGNDRMATESNIYAAMCYTLVKKYDSAALLLRKAEPVVLQSADAALKTSFFARKAELSRFTENWQQAVENYDKAIQNAMVTSNIYMQATFTHARARCLLKLNRIQEAREAGLQALLLSRSINKKREILESQKVLSLVEAAAGNYPKAYTYLEQYQQGNDSLRTEEITEKLQALDKKYQSALQQEKISQLEKDKQIQVFATRRKENLNYVLGSGLLLSLIIGGLGYRNYQQRQSLQRQRILELEKEKQLNAAEAVLKGEEQERRRLAKDLHDGLGGMLSGIKFSLQHMQSELPNDAQPAIDRSLDMLDSSISEMRRVAHNMMPEVLMRFGLDKALQDYCHSIREHGQLQLVYQSSGLDQMEKGTSIDITVYRIVQELMNNIVKHAQAKNALVQATFLEDKLTITVEDDGVGFEPDKTNEKGIGWTNILSRVAFLNGQIDVKSGTGEGTSVLVELPANADAST
jgi:signal transduction histidine kinase